MCDPGLQSSSSDLLGSGFQQQIMPVIGQIANGKVHILDG
jgi:hypothetical protein